MEEHRDIMELPEQFSKILRCKDDEQLTIVSGISGIRELTGYTEDEIREDFGCSFLNLIHSEDRLTVLKEVKAQLCSDKTAEMEFRIFAKDGSVVGVLSSCSRISGENGDHFLYGFLIDNTRVQKQRETEKKQLREQVRKNEHIFNLVSEHSNRILYGYDLTTGMIAPWKREEAEDSGSPCLYAGIYSEEQLDRISNIMPQNIRDLKKMFRDIQNSVPSGDLNIQFKLEDGSYRWHHLRFSTIFEDGKPVSALISTEDVTEQHEHQLVYHHYRQSLESDLENRKLAMEVDLTANRVEKLSGTIPELLSEDFSAMEDMYSRLSIHLRRSGFRYLDGLDGFQFLSRGNLLYMYEKGERNLQNEWQLCFPDGSVHWLNADVTMIEDPFNDNIKASIRISDITKEYEKQQLLLQQAEQDAMTGLLRREIGESRIRKCMDAHEEPGGILILIDLDNLKTLNDTLGHLYGDKAIATFSELLKKSFRRDDILFRSGGDEFMAYLPGAGHGIHAVNRLLSTLLRTCSSTFLEDNDRYPLRCSIGCAVENPKTDTFDALYQRADLALYHVKRSGKNNFAFYEPQMENGEYELHPKKLLSIPNSQRFALDKLQSFLGSMASFYQLVLSVNLNVNTYYLMEENQEDVFAHIPTVGALSDFLDMAAKAVHRDDLDDYVKHLSRENLLSAYQRGEENLRYHFRFFHNGSYRWVECLVIFYLNDHGEVCNFSMLRWADDKSKELEQLYHTEQGDTDRDGSGQENGPISMEETLICCLNTLTREKNPDAAFQRFLELVGKYYQANRAYIFEFDRKHQTADNTFEWCTAGVLPERDKLKQLPLALLDVWTERFETVGDFCISSVDDTFEYREEIHQILQAQGVHSMLAAPLHRDGRVVGFVGVDDPRVKNHDLTLLRAVSGFVLEELEKRHLTAQLEHLSYVDVLTGLKNRNQYVQFLESLDIDVPEALGVVIMDINGLREINDTHGLQYGDQVLKRVADILKKHFTQNLYRIGGDEFVVLCTDISKEEFQRRIIALRGAFNTDENCDVSMGFAWSTEKELMDVHALCQRAQEVCHAEKQSYYHNVLNGKHSVSHTGLAGEVIREIENEKFLVYYQPQVELKTGKIIGAEALVRKKAEDGSMIPPGTFIPYYEIGGVISHVDLFVLKTACADLRKWKKRGYHLRISVNFSRITLMEPHIVDSIREICMEQSIPASAITIEVTESIGKMGNEHLQELIGALRGAGFHISLDDFGSQYSNLAILSLMDFDEIKFDRSLVNMLEENKKSRLVMESSLQLCRSMEGTVSLAEGIETEGQLELLKTYRCDYGQGYYFAKPLPVDAFESFVKARGAV